MSLNFNVQEIPAPISIGGCELEFTEMHSELNEVRNDVIVVAGVEELEILVYFVCPVCVLLDRPESIHCFLAVFRTNIV